MDTLSETEKFVLRNLITDHWDAYVSECERHEDVSPDVLFTKVGSANDDRQLWEMLPPYVRHPGKSIEE